MAQGHIIPSLALASELEDRGYDITFVSTPLNIKNLVSSSFPWNSSSMQFRDIPFNSSDHGLPPNTENTDSLPHDLILRLLEATTSFKPSFRHLVKNVIEERGTPPLCIIADYFFGRTAEIAREHNIYHLVFVEDGTYGMAEYYSLWTRIPSWKVEGAQEFDNEDFPEGGKIHISQLSAAMAAANGLDSWSVYLKETLPEMRKSNGILFNTVDGIDKVGLGYFRRKLQLPTYSIGPLLFKKRGFTSHECLEWLDTKPTNSVVYISFGSQNNLTKSQMIELATALEASKKPSLWMVRLPLEVDHKSEFKADEWLPKGFEQRMQDQKTGLLVRKWAPQLEILSHKSVGGFISHCGWNSVLEAVSHGVPILGWPLAADQFFNAKLLVETVGVCVELARGNACEVNYEDITKKIEMVMGENDEAVRIRRRASEVKLVFDDARKNGLAFKGSSIQAMDEFLNAAMLMKSEKSN